MDIKREKIDKPAAKSVLQGDEKFLNKILSRNSSVGRVSQHYRSIGKVPFEWETSPGTPRTTPSRETKVRTKESYTEEENIWIRLVTPPPFVESSRLPKPQIWSKKGKSNLPNSSSFWWKNIWKRRKEIHRENKDHHFHADGNRLLFDNSEIFKVLNSDDTDFIRPSASNSNFSRSSSLPNSGDDQAPVQSSKLKGLAWKIVNWKF